MSDKDKSFITRLFAVCIAFLLTFMVLAMVGSLIAARLLNVTVDADRIWGVLGQNFSLMVTCVLAWLTIGSKPTKPEPADPGSTKET